MTSTTEPTVGDKRPRDEDMSEPNPNQPPASRSNGTPQLQSGPLSNIGSNQDVKMNGNYGTAMPMVMPAGGQMLNGAMGMGYDALYIGDLQWVSLVTRFLVCILICDFVLHPCVFAVDD